MKSQHYVKAIVYLTVLVWTVVLLLNHEALKSTWLAPLSTVTSVVLILVMAFDLWLWKLRFLQGWFVKRPVIDGTWKVRLVSNYKNPDTGAAIPPIEGYVVVRQTLSTLSLRLLTEESTSELIGAEIVSASDGLYSVCGVYHNEPRFQVRHRSEIHYGAIWLDIIQQPEQQLTGHYWTDRNTAGEMELTQRQHEQFQTFQTAKKHYDQLPTGSGESAP